jgi:hypothetical protein
MNIIELMKGAAGSSKTFLYVFHTPWRYTPEDGNIKFVVTITKPNEVTF